MEGEEKDFLVLYISTCIANQVFMMDMIYRSYENK